MIMHTAAAELSGVRHQTASFNGTQLHYVAAGDEGTPILLVHGFPETWWAFHKLIPLLSPAHRVLALDLRGFGESDVAEGEVNSKVVAADLHALIEHLGLGPVHLVAQDIAGGAAFRLATQEPSDLLSLTAVEMGLAGFGLEGLADVTHGGSWHIGALAAPKVPDLLLAGREHPFIDFIIRGMTVDQTTVSELDVAEFARTYSRVGGWAGASGLYRSMLSEGSDFVQQTAREPLRLPLLAVGAGGGGFTAMTMSKVSAVPIREVQLQGVGHYVALEAPEQLASAILDFARNVDRT
jgi:pimeloyl-ACP methyl ester carboxylesterase